MPVVTLGAQLKPDASGDGLVHLSQVAELHPRWHRLTEPRRVADLLVKVEVRAGRLADDDELAVLVVGLVDVAGVGVGDLIAHRVSLLLERRLGVMVGLRVGSVV